GVSMMSTMGIAEGWKGGRKEGWKDGRVEGGRVEGGRTEGWKEEGRKEEGRKDGRVEGCLVLKKVDGLMALVLR
ncbi:MAG: hypothetical protein RBT71_11560, partial [Flavobacteriales bacterium]|nr:hypothetical protein [Flavobacteriales bacterium]